MESGNEYLHKKFRRQERMCAFNTISLSVDEISALIEKRSSVKRRSTVFNANENIQQRRKSARINEISLSGRTVMNKYKNFITWEEEDTLSLMKMSSNNKKAPQTPVKLSTKVTPKHLKKTTSNIQIEPVTAVENHPLTVSNELELICEKESEYFALKTKVERGQLTNPPNNKFNPKKIKEPVPRMKILPVTDVEQHPLTSINGQQFRFENENEYVTMKTKEERKHKVSPNNFKKAATSMMIEPVSALDNDPLTVMNWQELTFLNENEYSAVKNKEERAEAVPIFANNRLTPKNAKKAATSRKIEPVSTMENDPSTVMNWQELTFINANEYSAVKNKEERAQAVPIFTNNRLTPKNVKKAATSKKTDPVSSMDNDALTMINWQELAFENEKTFSALKNREELSQVTPKSVKKIASNIQIEPVAAMEDDPLAVINGNRNAHSALKIKAPRTRCSKNKKKSNSTSNPIQIENDVIDSEAALLDRLLSLIRKSFT